MHNRYVLSALAGVMLFICLLVGYGIYINGVSNAHVEKLTAAQYSTVTGAKVQYREMIPTLYFPAIKLKAATMLDTHFKVDGTITKVYISPGDQVREGQLLGEVVNDELPSQLVQAQSKINEATANYIKWDETLQRYQGIVDTGAISRQQMDEAVANRSVAMAEIASNQAYLEQMETRVTGQKVVAPRDGEVLQVYYSSGANVQAGESLAMIGDFSILSARINLRDELLQPLLPQNGNLKLVMPEGNLRDKVYNSGYRAANQLSDWEFAVTMVSVEPPAQVASQYRTVVLKVNNSAILLEPRTYSKVKIRGTEKQSALAIPRAALMDENEVVQKATVFVVTEDNRLERRQVAIGMQDDTCVEICQGLAENEIVVVSGKIGLTPGLKVQVTVDSY